MSRNSGEATLLECLKHYFYGVVTLGCQIFWQTEGPAKVLRRQKKKKIGTILCRNSDFTHDLSLKLLQFTVCGTLDVTVYCDRRLPGKSRPLRK